MNQKLTADKKTLILCLDKSGSMAGTPINSLKEGSLMIGQKVLADPPLFEQLITITFDSSANSKSFSSIKDLD